MFTIAQEHTTMNIKFNGANPCTPKNLAKQLIVESAKLLNNEQRQALVDIFKTLDQAERTNHTIAQHQAEAELNQQSIAPSYEFQDEYNQEYWSGHHEESYSQEYPEDWLRRTQQRPHRSFAHPEF